MTSKTAPHWHDEERRALLAIYGRLIRRFGFDHVMRRMDQGWINRCAKARVLAEQEVAA